jgi:hypothetical protein
VLNCERFIPKFRIKCIVFASCQCTSLLFFCLHLRSLSGAAIATETDKKLEEAFACQLEEQERVYGPVSTPLVLPPDLPDLNQDNCKIGLGSTRSSLSSVSEG